MDLGQEVEACFRQETNDRHHPGDASGCECTARETGQEDLVASGVVVCKEGVAVADVFLKTLPCGACDIELVHSSKRGRC